jgi:hypothetical protein
MPRSHANVANSERLLQDIDFTEVVEAFGIVRNNELADLRCFLMEAGSKCGDLHALSAFLKDMEFSIDFTFDQLHKAAMELGLGDQRIETITVRSPDSLFKIVQRCRNKEKIRCHERAGFNVDEVFEFQKAFDYFAPPALGGELHPQDLVSMLSFLGILANQEDNDERFGELAAATECDQREKFSFTECLHAARRLFDEAEVKAVLTERSAQEEADIPLEDVEELRKVYDMYADEEDQCEFNFFALSKAIRLVMGSSFTPAQTKVLDDIYNLHAKPSKTHRMQSDALCLPFPEFLKVVHELSQNDKFPGLLTQSRETEESQPGQPSPNSARHRRLSRNSLFFAKGKIV